MFILYDGSTTLAAANRVTGVGQDNLGTGGLGDVVKPGDMVEVIVLGVNSADKRIALGLKQALGDPWEEALKKYPVGSVVEGPVTSLAKFGAFVDLGGGIEGMTSNDVKRYIRFIADRRLIQLGLQPIYRADAKNPLPWMDQMLNAIEHTNFFENRATEYSKASTRGSWDEAFS